MAETYVQIDNRSAAYDPVVHPLLYDGVRTKRVLAFLVDAAIIFALMMLASIVIIVLGIFTLGAGWLLFPLVWPVVAMAYNAFTLGGPHSATPGMRMMGIEMRTWDGSGLNPVIAVLHAIGFWLSVSFLTPLILLVSLFTPRKQLLQDLALGTFVVRSPY